MVRLLMVALSLALVGCSDKPVTAQVSQSLTSQFSGQKTSDFFLSYGRPISDEPSGKGGKSYRWASIEQSDAPGSLTYRNYLAPAAGRIPLAGATNPSATGSELYCEIKIDADAKDLIQNISIISDSHGKWGNSRCRELFIKNPISPSF